MILQMCECVCSICVLYFFFLFLFGSKFKFKNFKLVARELLCKCMQIFIFQSNPFFLSSSLFNCTTKYYFIHFFIDPKYYCMNFVSFLFVERRCGELRRFLLPKLHSSHLHLKSTKELNI